MTDDDPDIRSGEAKRTDEPCDNCGSDLLKLVPDDTSGSPHDVAYLCDNCGMVDRYETDEE